MEPLTTVRSRAVPVLQANVDTDLITPMRRLAGGQRHPLHHYAFEAWRYSGGDGDHGALDPAFPLNDPELTGAEIMLTGPNFGCGSSRETAPAAIADLGFRVLIGTTFADIFYANCFQRGLLPVTIDPATLEVLVAHPRAEIEVDLRQQRLTAAEADVAVDFEIDALRKTSLLEGQDLIGLTMRRDEEVRHYERQRTGDRPWLQTLRSRA